MKKCKFCDAEISAGMRGFICVTCKNGLDRYGLNRLDMMNLYESQDRKCKLCNKDVELFSKRKPNSGVIDHDHATDKIRGILCHPCNTSLGYIERNLSLERVRSYLRS